MPINPYQVNQIKESILAFISSKGPSLPIHLAKNVRTEPLFVNAFLSELYKDGKLKMSHMKVGSSSLYYLKGQEAQLENFIEHLNQKEKEAFFLLKEKKVLEDDSLPPAIRVALRSLKDFAYPINLVNEKNENKLFWRYFLFPENEVLNHINSQEKQPQATSKEMEMIPAQNPTQETQKIVQEKIQQKNQTPNAVPEKQMETKQNKSKKLKLKENFEFPAKIKDFLAGRDIEILSILEEKKKEFNAKVRIDTLFGKQEYLLIAKEKKKVSDTDLALALQKAQAEKMPALLLSPGEIDKKAISYLQEWKNLLKFEKIKC